MPCFLNFVISKENTVEISIIIVNYKTSKLILNAINSIFKLSEGFSFEIIVIDNNSKDGSIDLLHDHFGGRIKIVGLDRNLGFGNANNVGITYAKGDYILFLNPDIILINNAIRMMLDHIKQNSMIGVVGGNLYSQDMKPAYSHSKFFPGFILDVLPLLTFGYSRKIFKNLHHNFTNCPLEVNVISGADFMIRRSLLEKVGYFNPIFFMYYEDTELCWRVRNAGYRLINLPKAKLIHLEGSSFESKDTRIRLSFESLAKYYTLTRGKLYKSLINAMYLFGININLIALQVFGRNSNYYRRLKKNFLVINLKQ